jgi:hypothetical protein
MSRGQKVRYLRTSDGVQLAWAEAGAGPCLVKASHWLSHLEYEWESPVWRHWIQFFADQFHFIAGTSGAAVCRTGTWASSRSSAGSRTWRR